jgi:AcrR family transcriptional regulator
MRGERAARPVRKRDRQKTEARLLQAGVEVMSELGYDAATTKRIAEAAGVNEQLITRYFGGKAGLLAAILRSYNKSELARERSARPAAAEKLEDEIAGFLSEADFTEDRERFARLALARATVDANVADALKDLRTEWYTPLLVERLRQHRARGAIDSAANLDLIADTLVHLRLGLAAYGRLLFGLGSPHLTALMESAAAVFARGLAPDPSSKPKPVAVRKQRTRT